MPLKCGSSQNIKEMKKAGVAASLTKAGKKRKKRK